MPCRLLAATFEVGSPVRVAQFWATMLGRDVVETAAIALLSGDTAQLGLAFAPSRTEKSGANRMHLHLTSVDLADQERKVETALRLGARQVDVGQLPEEGHVVLADPGDNEFCVIEPGNSFLAGCGLLGELACDGSREVGLFWSEALGWPLVWDRDEETAIQSAVGGTKVSWGGPPLAPRAVPDRQRFDLVMDGGDLDAEAERLIGVGAQRMARGEGDGVVLADPDGAEFRLYPAWAAEEA
jgi:hypothetical protein